MIRWTCVFNTATCLRVNNSLRRGLVVCLCQPTDGHEGQARYCQLIID